MPLLDHFHPPLSVSRVWSAFYTNWAVRICDSLNARLPTPRFLAEVELSFDPHSQRDVAEASDAPDIVIGEPRAARSLTMPFPEEVAVRVYDFRAGRTLVGVIELVSPANKDRPATRRAFAMKCATFLHDRIGLVLVDIVTEYRANLHRELLALLGDGHAGDLPEDSHLYAVAYRPVLRKDEGQLDLWPRPLAVGEPLPVLPLALRGSFVVPIDLEATYAEARRHCYL